MRMISAYPPIKKKYERGICATSSSEEKKLMYMERRETNEAYLQQAVT